MPFRRRRRGHRDRPDHAAAGSSRNDLDGLDDRRRGPPPGPGDERVPGGGRPPRHGPRRGNRQPRLPPLVVTDGADGVGPPGSRTHFGSMMGPSPAVTGLARQVHSDSVDRCRPRSSARSTARSRGGAHGHHHDLTRFAERGPHPGALPRGQPRLPGREPRGPRAGGGPALRDQREGPAEGARGGPALLGPLPGGPAHLRERRPGHPVPSGAERQRGLPRPRRAPAPAGRGPGPAPAHHHAHEPAHPPGGARARPGRGRRRGLHPQAGRGAGLVDPLPLRYRLAGPGPLRHDAESREADHRGLPATWCPRWSGDRSSR